jgi:hypothetical protein
MGLFGQQYGRGLADRLAGINCIWARPHMGRRASKEVIQGAGGQPTAGTTRFLSADAVRNGERLPSRRSYSCLPDGRNRTAPEIRTLRATGLTRVHANRTLQVLRREGLVEVKHNAVIHDWEALARAADFNDEYLQMTVTPQKRLPFRTAS